MRSIKVETFLDLCCILTHVSLLLCCPWKQKLIDYQGSISKLLFYTDSLLGTQCDYNSDSKGGNLKICWMFPSDLCPLTGHQSASCEWHGSHLGYWCLSRWHGWHLCSVGMQRPCPSVKHLAYNNPQTRLLCPGTHPLLLFFAIYF